MNKRKSVLTHICSLIVVAVATAPSFADANFTTRWQELTKRKQELMVEAATGHFDTRASAVRLGSEITVGSEKSDSVLLLYTSVDCSHCYTVLADLDQKSQMEPDWFKDVALIHRHAGELLDGVIISCLIAGRSALYPAVFRMVVERKASDWTAAEVEQMLRITGQEPDIETCLSKLSLEKSYHDFVELLSLCNISGCPTIDRLNETFDYPAVLPITPVLYVGRRSSDGKLLEIQDVVRGAAISDYLDMEF